MQGVGDLWTDPQMHSHDGKGYGKGNMGRKGIHAFLQNHRCNAICAALNLPVVVRAYMYMMYKYMYKYMYVYACIHLCLYIHFLVINYL
jgi:hypothetical protein